MSIHWNIVQNSNSLIPCLVERIKLGGKEIIETGGIKTTGIDVVEFHDNIRVTEVKLLVDGVDFTNELCTLQSHVNNHRVVTLKSISKMF